MRGIRVSFPWASVSIHPCMYRSNTYTTTPPKKKFKKKNLQPCLLKSAQISEISITASPHRSEPCTACQGLTTLCSLARRFGRFLPARSGTPSLPQAGADASPPPGPRRSPHGPRPSALPRAPSNGSVPARGAGLGAAPTLPGNRRHNGRAALRAPARPAPLRPAPLRPRRLPCAPETRTEPSVACHHPYTQLRDSSAVSRPAPSKGSRSSARWEGMERNAPVSSHFHP